MIRAKIGDHTIPNRHRFETSAGFRLRLDPTIVKDEVGNRQDYRL